DGLAQRDRYSALLRPGVVVALAVIQAVDKSQREDRIDRPGVVAAPAVVMMMVMHVPLGRRCPMAMAVPDHHRPAVLVVPAGVPVRLLVMLVFAAVPASGVTVLAVVLGVPLVTAV